MRMIGDRGSDRVSLSFNSFACTAKCKARPKGKSVHGYHTLHFRQSFTKNPCPRVLAFFKVFTHTKVPLLLLRACVHATLQSCRVCIPIAIGSTSLMRKLHRLWLIYFVVVNFFSLFLLTCD